MNLHAGVDGIDIGLPAGSVINLTQALPDLIKSVSIIGPGADKLAVRRTTIGDYRIFTVTVPAPGHGGLLRPHDR